MKILTHPPSIPYVHTVASKYNFFAFHPVSSLLTQISALLTQFLLCSPTFEKRRNLGEKRRNLGEKRRNCTLRPPYVQCNFGIPMHRVPTSSSMMWVYCCMLLAPMSCLSRMLVVAYSRRVSSEACLSIPIYREKPSNHMAV